MSLFFLFYYTVSIYFHHEGFFYFGPAQSNIPLFLGFTIFYSPLH